MADVVVSVVVLVGVSALGATVFSWVTLRVIRSLFELGEYEIYSVHHDGAPLKGIPFFLKKRSYVRTTIYHEPLATVELHISREGQDKGPIFEGRRMVRLDDESKPAVHKIFPTGPSLTLSEVDTLIDAFRSLPTRGTARPSDEAVIHVATTRTMLTEVDYSAPYYINSRRSYIGAAEMAIELNSDGTLSKGSSKFDASTLPTSAEKLGSSAFGVLPTEKIWSSLWGGEPAGDEESRKEDEESRKEDETRFAWDLSVVPTTVVHRLSLLESEEPDASPIPIHETSDVWYQSEILGGAAETGDGAEPSGNGGTTDSANTDDRSAMAARADT